MAFAKMVRAIQKNNGVVKVLVVGRDNSGKSTILSRIAGTDSCIPPTFGFEIMTVPYRKLTLNIYDMGGQESFRKYWSNHFEHTDLAIYVIDITNDTQRLELFDSIADLGIPIAVFLNKIDLVEPENLENDDFQSFVKSLERRDNTKVFLTSAVLRRGIEEGFEWLLGHEALSGIC